MSAVQTLEETKPSSASLAKTVRATNEQDNNMLHMPAEAQWMLAVLDDITAKLSLVSHLTPDIMKDKIIDALDPDVVIALRVHFQIEKQFENLLAQKANQGNTTNVNDSLADEEIPGALDAQITEVSVCILDSIRTVAGILAETPLLVRRMRELRPDNGSRGTFLHALGRLRSVTASTLRLTADEQNSINAQLAGFAQREAQDQQRFCSLTDQLASHRARHAQTLQAQQAQINRLKQEIADAKNACSAAGAELEDALLRGGEAIVAEGAREEKRMQKEVQTLSAKLDNSAAEHYRTQAQRLRQRDLKLGDIASTIATYDEQLSKRHAKLHKLMLATDRDTRKTVRLQKYLEHNQEAAEALATEHSTIGMNRETELAVERRRHDNSAMAHELHASYLARKAQEEKLLAQITLLKKQGKLKPGQSIAGALREAQANGGVLKTNKK